MAANFRYSLDSRPSLHGDGSGMVTHAIHAEYDDGGGWAVVPGRRKTFNVPSAEMKAVNDMPDGTAPERQAKIRAYKDALSFNVNTQNVGIQGWSTAQMQAFLDAKAAAQVEADRADEFITVTLGQEYPVPFTI